MILIRGYMCVEMFERQLLIVKLALSDRLKKIFLCIEPPKFILSVTTHEFRSVRTVIVKPLKGNQIIGTKKDEFRYGWVRCREQWRGC